MVLAFERLDALSLFRCRTGPTRARSHSACRTQFRSVSPEQPSSRQSSGSPTIARRARLGDPKPSELRGHGPRGNTAELASSWLHPLRSWSLRETRDGSAPLFRFRLRHRSNSSHSSKNLCLSHGSAQCHRARLGTVDLRQRCTWAARGLDVLSPRARFRLSGPAGMKYSDTLNSYPCLPAEQKLGTIVIPNCANRTFALKPAFLKTAKTERTNPTLVSSTHQLARYPNWPGRDTADR